MSTSTPALEILGRDERCGWRLHCLWLGDFCDTHTHTSIQLHLFVTFGQPSRSNMIEHKDKYIRNYSPPADQGRPSSLFRYAFRCTPYDQVRPANGEVRADQRMGLGHRRGAESGDGVARVRDGWRISFGDVRRQSGDDVKPCEAQKKSHSDTGFWDGFGVLEEKMPWADPEQL